MQLFQVKPIGKVSIGEGGARVELEPGYAPALQALDGFGHVNVIWWFSGFDGEEARSALETPQPYKKAPEVMGVFATRSPVRPNPIALSAAGVTGIDHEKGVIHIDWIDAEDGSPVLDIKPYTPSLDRVGEPRMPEWCAHWPKSVEASGDFDWEAEFTLSGH